MWIASLEQLFGLEEVSQASSPRAHRCWQPAGSEANCSWQPDKRLCFSLQANREPPVILSSHVCPSLRSPPVLCIACDNDPTAASINTMMTMRRNVPAVNTKYTSCASCKQLTSKQACCLSKTDMGIVPRKRPFEVCEGLVLEETVVTPGGEVSRAMVSVTRPRPVVITSAMQEQVSRSMAHQFPTNKTASENNQVLTVEVDAAVTRAEAWQAQGVHVAVSFPSSSSQGSSTCDRNLEEEIVEAAHEAPVLTKCASPCGPSRVATTCKVSRCRHPGKSPANWDSACSIPIASLDGRVGSQKRSDCTGLVERWIRKLDVKGIMDGSIAKPLVLLRGARQVHTHMMEHGAASDAARLEAHLQVSAAAAELPRYKLMPQVELLDVIDVLEEAQIQLPASIGVEILRMASKRVPGSSAPDAADMLDMMWMWPMAPAAPAAQFQARNPKLADLHMNMSDTASTFKSCYMDNYIGAMLAMGPGQDIDNAADMFLDRWQYWSASNSRVPAYCPGREAANGTAPRAQKHLHLL